MFYLPNGPGVLTGVGTPANVLYMNTNQILKNKAAERNTDTLIGALLILEAKCNLTADERMVKAATSDAITERHGLDDLLDEIFEDLDFAGTYTDALLIALAKVGA